MPKERGGAGRLIASTPEERPFGYCYLFSCFLGITVCPGSHRHPLDAGQRMGTMAGDFGQAGGSGTPSCGIFPWGEEGAKDRRRGCAGPRCVADSRTGAEEHRDRDRSIGAVFAPCTIKRLLGFHFILQPVAMSLLPFGMAWREGKLQACVGCFFFPPHPLELLTPSTHRERV